ncbi:MAG: YegS/Rv2252/BmrU family lipid kinase [Chitinophagaceae bacterium]|nr:YegS/Rv2252/BmrU family lipid kinase [Chitinophagaceae bacterium]
MKRKIIYLINPISGTKSKTVLLETIQRKTSEREIDFEILPTVASGDYSFLEDKITSEGIKEIGICGGDGSVNQVVQSLAHLDLNFGIIPMGSGNGLALTAGISRKPEKALEIIFDGIPKRIDAFLVNKQFACMLAGLGFDASVAHEFAQQSKRGLGTYASLSTKKFFAAEAYPFTIEANNLSFTTDAFLVSIANSNQFGNNFTIAPEALLSDGLLDIVIVKKVAKPFLIYNVMKQVLAGHSDKFENSLASPVIYFQTPSLRITNTENAPLHIDGEPRESLIDMKIKVLPSYFKLIHAK